MKGTCLKGRYLLGEVIGKGGMAVVYKAYDFRSGRTVAVKVLREQYNQDREFVRRFQQEAEAASAVSHENLIDIYDVGEQNGARFIVMEYVDGMTLKSLIQEHGALDNYTAITIARQICTALQIAHDAHIIHRDIKPQNILLDRKGINARVMQRRSSHMVYLKSGAAILEFLAFTGAHQSALSMENARVIKSVRNDVNRMTNAEIANQAKAASASVDQIYAIREVLEAHGMENLPPALQEFIRLRVTYPDATLKELGERATPPLSKSAVYHRVRRIEQMAKELHR